MSGYTLQNIQAALDLESFDVLAAQQLMIPRIRRNERPPEMQGEPRVGGVLLLLYCYQQQMHVVLTRRRDDLNAHAGQISFPGGRREAGETAVQTALRETYEEIGVPPADISILGELTSIYIPPSDFEVHPYVGWVHNGERPSFTPQISEVAEIIETPLSHLMQPESRRSEPWEFRGSQVTVPFFDVDGHKVWGATAIMLSEFLERLRTVMSANGHVK